jgi:hypothetical protein
VGGGKGLPLIHFNTSGHWAQLALKLMYIKLPMYLFFIWRLDLLVLMRANPVLRPLEWVGPEIQTFLGPEMAMSKASATPSNGLYNAYCPHQNHYLPRHINIRYIDSFLSIILPVLKIAVPVL